jgi:hypothetical protein
VTLADRVMALAVNVLWSGHRRRRAVIVKPGQGELVRGLDTSREVKVLTISPLRYPGAARSGPAAGIFAGSFHQMPGTPSTITP